MVTATMIQMKLGDTDMFVAFGQALLLRLFMRCLMDVKRYTFRIEYIYLFIFIFAGDEHYRAAGSHVFHQLLEEVP